MAGKIDAYVQYRNGLLSNCHGSKPNSYHHMYCNSRDLEGVDVLLETNHDRIVEQKHLVAPSNLKIHLNTSKV